MVHLEWRQIVAVAATELGVLFEQAFLDVEPKLFGFVVIKPLSGFAERELIDLAVGEEHIVEGLAAVLGLFSDQLFRPDFFDLETLGELNQLP